MKALADGYVVSRGLIKGDEYSFLLDSKTALFVSYPEGQLAGGVSIFFLGISLAAAAGVWLDGKTFALMLPLLFVACLSAISLFRNFRSRYVRKEWKLYLGSGESPVLIYSTPDAAAFEAKRNEIEQALLTRLEE
jgi:hypothetical protein